LGKKKAVCLEEKEKNLNHYSSLKVFGKNEPLEHRWGIKRCMINIRQVHYTGTALYLAHPYLHYITVVEKLLWWVTGKLRTSTLRVATATQQRRLVQLNTELYTFLYRRILHKTPQSVERVLGKLALKRRNHLGLTEACQIFQQFFSKNIESMLSVQFVTRQCIVMH